MATKRPPGLIYDDADLDAVVRTMLGEAAGEGDEGLAAVAHVIVNRLEKGGYGKSLYSVSHAPKQFSAWNSSGNGGNDLVNIGPDDPRYQQARAIAEEVLNGQREDNTGGAVNYFAPKGMTGKDGTKKGDPDWASRMSYTTTIGGHKFYSDDSAAAAAENLANGGDVAGLQQQLAQRGFDPGAIDGVKGPRTIAAIKAFQKANGLDDDGIVGPLTQAALDRQQRPHTQPQPRLGSRQPANILPPGELIQPQDIRDAFFDPLPAPKPLEAPGVWQGPVLGNNNLSSPTLGASVPLPRERPEPPGAAITAQPSPVAPPEAPEAPAAPSGGFNLGGMISDLGNTLGTAAQNVGTTLGNAATNVVEGTKQAAANTAQSVKDTLTNELMGTVKGRTLLMNTALGIEPRRDRAVERRISAPEGYGYSSTGKKLYRIGQVYNSSRGQVVFDGSKFVPAGAQVRSSVDVPGHPNLSSKPRETFDSVWAEARG